MLDVRLERGEVRRSERRRGCTMRSPLLASHYESAISMQSRLSTPSSSYAAAPTAFP